MSDDAGTLYHAARLGQAGVGGGSIAGRTAFYAVPPSRACWLEILDRGMRLVRVPLS